ncbi:MAG: DUF2070 family protein, partial [Candidatus Bilamarchaeaceae archaeon]
MEKSGTTETVGKEEGNPNLKRAVNLTNYFVSLPPLPIIVVSMIAIALIFGIVLNLPPSSDFLKNLLLDSAMLLLFPAVLTSVVIKMLIRKVPFKRILATAAVGEVIYGLAYVVSSFVFNINPLYGEMILFIGAAIVFVMWYLVARLIFVLKYRAFLFAILQLLFYLLFFFNSKLPKFVEAPAVSVVARTYIASFILLGAMYVFFYIINAPMKKTFGVTSTDVFSLFINQWIYKKKDLESAFERVGESAKTLLGIAGFERKNDTVLFIVPHVHFGPFGNLGGSEFSFLIAEEITKKYPNTHVFVFHAPVTHDLNPTSSSEINKITEAVEKTLRRAEYRNETVALSRGKSEECLAEALIFGRDAFIGVSRAPHVTEDINFGLGLSMLLKAEKYMDRAIIVDQHNAETGEITSFEPGSAVGYNYIKAIEKSLTKIPKQTSLRLGISEKHPASTTLGSGGIKIAVFSTSPQYVIILMDANGITPEFKNRIENEISTLGKYAVGVFTTDTHQINTIRGVLNPAKEEAAIINAIKEGVKEAVADIQEASAF